MFKKLLAAIAEKFKKNNIPYIIIGGQAVLLYGEPRLTKDIDITIGLNIDALDRIILIMKKIPLQPLPKDYHQFVQRTMVLPLLHTESSIRVDVIFSYSPFEQEAIGRANPVIIDGTTVNFASLEDLIIFKVFAGRQRDLDDVRTILLKNPKADLKFIKSKLEFLSYEEKNFVDNFEQILKSI